MQDYSGIRRIAVAGVLLAITLLLVFARIGMIPVPTPAGNATVAHIPAIVAGILEGPLVGLIVGLGFGFASFMTAAIPMFKDPLVAIFPRLLIGVTSALAYAGLRGATKSLLRVLVVVLLIVLLIFAWQITQFILWAAIVWAVLSLVACGFLVFWMEHVETAVVAIGIAAAVGSLTNTILVLSVAVLRGYIPGEAALGIALTHGIPEVVVSGIVSVGVVSALKQIGDRKGSSL